MAYRGRTIREGQQDPPWSAAFAAPGDAPPPGGSGRAPPEGLAAVDFALVRGMAAVAEALAALDRAARLLEDCRWLLQSLADAAAPAAERHAAIRGFGTTRLRLRAVCEGIALLDGTLRRGLRVITGLDGGAITVAAHDLRPALAALAEAPSPRLAAAMLAPHGALAEAARAVAAAQRQLAADHRRLGNRQSLNAALALAWGDGSFQPPPTLLQRLAAMLRARSIA